MWNNARAAAVEIWNIRISITESNYWNSVFNFPWSCCSTCWDVDLSRDCVAWNHGVRRASLHQLRWKTNSHSSKSRDNDLDVYYRSSLFESQPSLTKCSVVFLRSSGMSVRLPYDAVSRYAVIEHRIRQGMTDCRLQLLRCIFIVTHLVRLQVLGKSQNSSEDNILFRILTFVSS